jgi:hypothetical protein
MKSIKILVSIVLGLMVYAGKAQQELSTHFMRGLWQANFTNPALLPEAKLTIALPNVFNDLYFSDITYNDIVKTNGAGETVVDLRGIADVLSDKNFLREVPMINTFGIGFRTERLFVSLSHAIRGNAFLKYPKELIEVVAEGNAQFIGQPIEIGPDFQVSTFHEISLGLGYRINPMLTVGGRIKVISGIADLSTDRNRNRLQLLTSDDVYQLQLTSNYLVNSSRFLNYDGFSDIDLDPDFGNGLGEGFFQGNISLGFDIGAQLRVGRLDVSLSILDIGQLSWEESVENYRYVDEYEYDGIDIENILLDNETGIQIVDTLRNIFQGDVSFSSYTSPLGTRMYLSSTYLLNNTWRIGGVAYAENFRGEWFPAVGVNIQGRPNQFIEFGVLYSYRDRRFDNLGLNLGLKLGPVQFIAASDNLLSAIDIGNANSANFRVGVNLALGRVEEPVDVDNIYNQDDFFN